jgi:hypothetical protein
MADDDELSPANEPGQAVSGQPAPVIRIEAEAVDGHI